MEVVIHKETPERVDHDEQDHAQQDDDARDETQPGSKSTLVCPPPPGASSATGSAPDQSANHPWGMDAEPPFEARESRLI